MSAAKCANKSDLVGMHITEYVLCEGKRAIQAQGCSFTELPYSDLLSVRGSSWLQYRAKTSWSDVGKNAAFLIPGPDLDTQPQTVMKTSASFIKALPDWLSSLVPCFVVLRLEYILATK